jgi:hypothetical protein
LYFGFIVVVQLINAGQYSFSKLPASHLVDSQVVGVIVGGKIAAKHADIVSNVKCFVYGELQVVENGMRCG